MTLLLIGAILVPLLAIPILYALSKRLRENTGFVSFIFLLVPLVTILYAGLQGSGSTQGTYQELYSWSPIGNFGFRVDNLSLPILFIIGLLTALVSLFSVPYMRQRIGDDPRRYGLYYSLYALYSLGMIGTVLATNLIEFYLFFEIMLVPSFFLIAEWGYGEPCGSPSPPRRNSSHRLSDRRDRHGCCNQQYYNKSGTDIHNPPSWDCRGDVLRILREDRPIRTPRLASIRLR
ncbi:hypothetical protein E6H34_09960 [Candidatus Bathyarchaeota archaeon]|nr:MAG: hypothetical protein E6H34_09960 [Candidatus Bathyarchaeota archaeon]